MYRFDKDKLCFTLGYSDMICMDFKYWHLTNQSVSKVQLIRTGPEGPEVMKHHMFCHHCGGAGSTRAPRGL